MEEVATSAFEGTYAVDVNANIKGFNYDSSGSSSSFASATRPY